MTKNTHFVRRLIEKATISETWIYKGPYSGHPNVGTQCSGKVSVRHPI